MVRVEYESLSSLPLEVLMYFNKLYSPLLFLVMGAEYIWKGVSLPYPNSILGLEIFMLFAYITLELVRLSLGSRGNKTETVGPIAYFLVLSLICVVGNVYWLLIQVYVTQLDFIMHLVAVVMTGLEFLFAIFAIMAFSRRKRV